MLMQQEVSDVQFREPRTNMDLDVEGNIRLLPADARCKGAFPRYLLNRIAKESPGVDLFREAGVEAKSFVPFLDYPYADMLRMSAKAASILYPTLRQAAGMRNIGQHAYRAIFGSEFGTAVFKSVGVDPMHLLMAGPLAYKVTINFGHLRVERIGSNHCRMTFTQLPGYLEHYHVGAVEGAILQFGYKPSVKIHLTDLANAVLDVQWQDSP